MAQTVDMSSLASHPTIVEDPLLSTQEFAKLASIKCRTLERWRLLGQGPAFIRVGGKRLVRYRVSSIDSFLRQTA